jgi:hypothetical protein
VKEGWKNGNVEKEEDGRLRPFNRIRAMAREYRRQETEWKASKLNADR